MSERYKFMGKGEMIILWWKILKLKFFEVDIKLGEKRGQGLVSAMRAVWDSDTDKKGMDYKINFSSFKA